ncbi:hypothetical protein SAMN05192575_107148 [Nocardioides alpinus]|uniref:Uncharacterized protein n=1 Tax=Nocardioides alpinus TaxID=748909 RepID=A0A1I1A271_9ACTN|nr:hypothetical protein [Nocardioides alpinus]PKH42159.1 hypothetical protein CXG46_06695 [Nocardioides alpinus]SFB32007.1 hypothetical protein SAMN05192575_107148 [Nocardioides alpinus]
MNSSTNETSEFDHDAFFARLPAQARPTPVDDDTYETPLDLLKRVTKFFVDSGDFNGLVVGESTKLHENAVGLINDGLVQLVTNTDYVNIHIRPWLRGDVERQVEELADVAAGGNSGCLYPTAKAMAALHPELSDAERPFRERLLQAGGGTLDVAYFELTAVEGYLNDPDFEFVLGDSGFRFADAPWLTDDLDYDNLTLLKEAGFAYDRTVDPLGPEPIKRYWAALLCDLAELPPLHQQRIRTYELTNPGPEVIPHPIWWRRMMGHWPEHIGPFTRILTEMNAINELWTLAFGADLFTSTVRPQNWGWLLRPSTREWEGFVLTTCKLLLDGISSAGLAAANAPKRNDNGDSLGSLMRLQELMVRQTAHLELNVPQALAPLHEVRLERQKPAHKTNQNLRDPLILNHQRDLLGRLGSAIGCIRYFVMGHPKVLAAEWQPPDLIDAWLSV